VWSDEHKAPYAYHNDQWVGYDDIESLTLKVMNSRTKKKLLKGISLKVKIEY
jgi:hypothetical protein